MPRKENAELYAKYKALADTTNDVHFVGRLATYKYYNMDQIVAQALTVYAKMVSAKRKEALAMGTATKTSAVVDLGSRRIRGNEVRKELTLTQ